MDEDYRQFEANDFTQVDQAFVKPILGALKDYRVYWGDEPWEDPEFEQKSGYYAIARGLQLEGLLFEGVELEEAVQTLRAWTLEAAHKYIGRYRHNLGLYPEDEGMPLTGELLQGLKQRIQTELAGKRGVMNRNLVFAIIRNHPAADGKVLQWNSSKGPAENSRTMMLFLNDTGFYKLVVQEKGTQVTATVPTADLVKQLGTICSNCPAAPGTHPPPPPHDVPGEVRDFELRHFARVIDHPNAVVRALHNFGYIRNAGGGDCGFLSIAQALKYSGLMFRDVDINGAMMRLRLWAAEFARDNYDEPQMQGSLEEFGEPIDSRERLYERVAAGGGIWLQQILLIGLIQRIRQELRGSFDVAILQNINTNSNRVLQIQTERVVPDTRVIVIYFNRETQHYEAVVQKIPRRTAFTAEDLSRTLAPICGNCPPGIPGDDHAPVPDPNPPLMAPLAFPKTARTVESRFVFPNTLSQFYNEYLFGMPPNVIIIHLNSKQELCFYQNGVSAKFMDGAFTHDKELFKKLTATDARVPLSSDHFLDGDLPGPARLSDYLNTINIRGDHWFQVKREMVRINDMVCNAKLRRTFRYDLEKTPPQLACQSIDQEWIQLQPLIRKSVATAMTGPWIKAFEETFLVRKTEAALSDEERLDILIRRTWLFHWFSPYRTHRPPNQDDKTLMTQLKKYIDEKVITFEHPLQTHAKAMKYEGLAYLMLDFRQPLHIRLIVYDPAERGQIYSQAIHLGRVMPGTYEQSKPYLIQWAIANCPVKQPKDRWSQGKELQGIKTAYAPLLAKSKDVLRQYKEGYDKTLKNYQEGKAYVRDLRAKRDREAVLRHKRRKEDLERDQSVNVTVSIDSTLTLSNEEIRKYCRAIYPKHPYPAFSTDKGVIEPMCGNDAWAVQLANPYELNHMRALHEMTYEWCTRPPRVIQLWRWLGLGCLSKEDIRLHLRTIFSRKALESSEFKRDLGAEDAKELEEGLRSSGEAAKKGQINCLQRITFLYEMLLSGIFLPFIRTEVECQKIASKYPDLVIVVPHWADPGVIRGCSYDSRTKQYSSQEVDSEALMHPIHDFWSASTRVRLWVFEQFEGRLCASSVQWMEHIRSQCVPSDDEKIPRTPTRFLPLVALLPSHMATDIRKAIRDPDGAVKLKKFSEMALMLASRGLTAREVDMFQKIKQWERQYHVSTPDIQAQLRTEMSNFYAQMFTSAQERNALHLEILNLCHRPEFMKYLRGKYARSKEGKAFTVEQIKNMSRSDICSRWLGVRHFDVPILLSTLTSVQVTLLDSALEPNVNRQLLDIYTKDLVKAQQIDEWLKETLGVTLANMQQYNTLDSLPQQRLGRQLRLKEETENALSGGAKPATLAPGATVKDTIQLLVDSVCVSDTPLTSKRLELFLRFKKLLQRLLKTPITQVKAFSEHCTFVKDAWDKIVRDSENVTEIRQQLEKTLEDFEAAERDNYENYQEVIDAEEPAMLKRKAGATPKPINEFLMYVIVECHRAGLMD